MTPDGWTHEPIKHLCESIIDCVNKTASIVDYKTPYKMIRTTNVRHGKVDVDNVRYVEEETYRKWVRRGAPRKGDLIFTREAPVGEVGILESDDNLFLGQRTMMYRSNPNMSSNLFLFYFLQTLFCQKQIENFSNGGTVAHMRVPDCGEIIIRVPPLPEQNKIAKILSTWDRAIEVTEKLLSNSQQQKKSLMQQLLTGKKRLLGFSGEWDKKALLKIANIVMGSSPKSESYNRLKKGLPLLQGNADIKNRLSAPRVHTSQITKECLVDDILLSVRAPVGEVSRSVHHACIGRGISAIRAKKDTSQNYLYQWLLHF